MTEPNFEDELIQALRREQPPQGFSERVLARLGAARAVPVRRMRIQRTWLALAAALAIAAFATVNIREFQTRRRAVAVKAGHDVALALNIAGAKLQSMQKVLRRRTNGV